MNHQSTLPRKSEYLTIGEAASLVGKTPSNISYLIQYDRLRKYNSGGERVDRADGKGLRVSRSELLSYISESKARMDRRMNQLSILDKELAFFDVPERLRTKHVHRLHPYLGKFIPQLVEYFLSRYFKPRQLVIDPFCGSGTTLVQASEMGINSVGIDISEFNTLISKVKLDRYDLQLVANEINDITKRTVLFSRDSAGNLPGTDTANSEYLKKWFADRSQSELIFFRNLISEYKYQDLLKVLLSRTARSCRLIYHYELATQSRAVTEPYVCYKHKGKICTPVTTIIHRLNFYAKDAIRRIVEFSRLRQENSQAVILEDDSRSVDVPF